MEFPLSTDIIHSTSNEEMFYRQYTARSWAGGDSGTSYGDSRRSSSRCVETKNRVLTRVARAERGWGPQIGEYRIQCTLISVYQCTLNGLRYTGLGKKGVIVNPVYPREKKYTAFRLQPLAVGNPVYSRKIRRYTGFRPQYTSKWS